MSIVRESIEVAVPVRVAYERLCHFEDYPQFMTSVQQVTQLSDSNTRIIAELDIDARQLMPFEAAEPDSLNRRLKADLTGLKQYVEYGATMSGGQSILGTGTSRGYLPDDAFNDEY